MHLEGFKPYRTTCWALCTLSTPAFRLHAFHNQDANPLAFGLKGDINHEFATDIIQIIDTQSSIIREGHVCEITGPLNDFNYIAMVDGPERHFMKGWSGTEGIDIGHVFPLFGCERTPSGGLPKFSDFRRRVDVFDVQRKPEPFYEFQMRGHQSGLKVTRWSTARVSELIGFIHVLMEDTKGIIKVRNRIMAELSIPEDMGWDKAEDAVWEHITTV